MAMEIKGKVIKIMPVQKISDKLEKAEIVVDTNTNPERRENPVAIEFHKTNYKDNASLLQGVQVGDEVTCTIDIRGRRWQPRDGGAERFFISLACWQLQKDNATYQDVDAVF